MDIKSTTPLSGLFRSSPFKPVQEHMRTVFSCICFIPPIMDALYRQDRDQIEMIAGVRRSEHNIDSILLRTKRTLFENEKGMDPVSVMYWYQLIDLLGSISDQAENVADRLLLFISK